MRFPVQFCQMNKTSCVPPSWLGREGIYRNACGVRRLKCLGDGVGPSHLRRTVRVASGVHQNCFFCVEVKVEGVRGTDFRLRIHRLKRLDKAYTRLSMASTTAPIMNNPNTRASSTSMDMLGYSWCQVVSDCLRGQFSYACCA